MSDYSTTMTTTHQFIPCEGEYVRTDLIESFADEGESIGVKTASRKYHFAGTLKEFLTTAGFTPKATP